VTAHNRGEGFMIDTVKIGGLPSHIGALVETIKPDKCANYPKNAGFNSVET
jgi:hypothetical protein